MPLQPGRRKAGGGIWSYASHLVRALDALAPDDVEIVCLAHPDLPLETRHLRVERLDVDAGTVARRLAWIHGALPRWCRRHGAAVLHKLATEAPFVGTGARLVVTVHDFMTEFYRAALPSVPRGAGDAYFALATRRAFARADRLVLLTDAVADEARRRFPAAAPRVTVVPNGVDHAALAPLAGRRAPDDGARELRIAHVAVFSPHKGQLQAIAALERLAERAPALAARCRLVFRGHASYPAYHAAVRAAAARSPMAARITFVDYAAAAGPAEIHGDADLLLLLSAYEGFGLPPLEAQAAGVPVVCSDLPVLREVLGDGARYAPRDDPDAVAAALAALLADPAARARQAEVGRANARRFAWERTARAMLDVYRREAGRSAAAAIGAGRP